jgi:RimJ/RimL family protein N-acetyltransferase
MICHPRPTRRTGARVRIRPIEREDRALLAEGLSRLSAETRYRRFLVPKQAFTEAELDYLTDVDHTDHEALVAVDARTGEALGIARYVRVGPDVAELAVTVTDDCQGRGVGARLVRLLAARARRAGIRSFVCLTLAGNARAIRLAQGLGTTTCTGTGAHLHVTTHIPRRWRLGRRRPAVRQVLRTVQALTPGAP